MLNIDDGNSQTEIEVTIDGLTITNGFLGDGGAENLGAGVFNRENLTLSNSRVINNAAGDDNGSTAKGSGIYTEGSLELVNSEVTGNTGNTFGAGIYALSANVNLINSTVSNNEIGFVGGGIYFKDSEFNLTSCLKKSLILMMG